LEQTLERKEDLLHDNTQQFLGYLKIAMPDMMQGLPNTPYKQ
jgi:hypothetical protein